MRSRVAAVVDRARTIFPAKTQPRHPGANGGGAKLLRSSLHRSIIAVPKQIEHAAFFAVRNSKVSNLASVAFDRVPAARARPSRLDEIDAMRMICFIAIVIIHAVPHGPRDSVINQLIVAATRFAVPFFFITSGFFLSTNAPYARIIWRALKRLAPIFVFWLIVYVLAMGADFSWLFKPELLARYLITGGPAYHLWYLPALGCSLAIVVAMRGYPVALICAATAFFLFGLAFGSYRGLLSLPDLPISTRNGPFFACRSLRWDISVAAMIGGLRWNLAGSGGSGFSVASRGTYLLADGQTPASDYYFGTLLFGVGVFYAALQLEHVPLSSALAVLGRVALGMYCVHALWLLWLANWFDAHKPRGWRSSARWLANGWIAIPCADTFADKVLSLVTIVERSPVGASRETVVVLLHCNNLAEE